jgi:hypothetical protein
VSKMEENYTSESSATSPTSTRCNNPRTELISIISYRGEPGELNRYSDWLQAGRRWGRSSSPGRIKNFLFSTSSRPVLGWTQPPIQCVPGALSPGVKRPGRETDHSPSASAEVKKMWIYTSIPPYAFMA